MGTYGLHQTRTLIAGFMVAIVLAACAPTVTSSIWEPIMMLAETEQSHAPALWIQGNTRVATWIGADAAGVHHDGRVLAGDTLADPITLPLPPRQPYDQQLLPATNDQYHLLWLDSEQNGALRLYTALLNADLSIERGPVALSDFRAGRYTAQAWGDGQALVLWSGGPQGEPVLYIQIVNARGIPEPPIPLLSAANWPTMIQANDGIRHLIWMDTRTQQLRYSQIVAGRLTVTEALENTLQLAAGERLHGLQLALDSTHLYLFWNMTRASGPDESWYVTRALDDTRWSEPQRLGMDTLIDNFIETGLNTGSVQAATGGDTWLTWAVPLAGQFDLLPVAVGKGDEVGIVYLQQGEVIGYQTVTPLPQPLIGPPILKTDRDRYLYVAWSEPVGNGKAQLKLADTRP